MGKTKDLSPFEQSMVVGARSTGLCQELPCCWVFHAQQFSLSINNGPPPRGETQWEDVLNVLFTQCRSIPSIYFNLYVY
jgi:hypothetical protein